MNVKKILYEQLAADLGCTSDDIKSNKNIFVCWKKLEGARRLANIVNINLVIYN